MVTSRIIVSLLPPTPGCHGEISHVILFLSIQALPEEVPAHPLTGVRQVMQVEETGNGPDQREVHPHLPVLLTLGSWKVLPGEKAHQCRQMVWFFQENEEIKTFKNYVFNKYLL